MNDKKIALKVAFVVGAISFVAAVLTLVLVMLALLIATGTVYPGWGILVPLACAPLAIAASTHTYHRATTLENS